jgi:hypothetical protein
MASRSFSVGSYTRNIDTQEDPFNQRVRAFKDDSLDSFEDNPEMWPKEKVKAAAEMFQRGDTKRVAIETNAAEFLTFHPELIDNNANGQAMNRTLKAMFGDCVHSVEQFEAAYRVLVANNSLALDKKVLAEQEKEAAKQRAEAQRARKVTFSEDERYSMPLEELRRLESSEIQKRNERIANEGGW